MAYTLNKSAKGEILRKRPAVVWSVHGKSYTSTSVNMCVHQTVHSVSRCPCTTRHCCASKRQLLPRQNNTVRWHRGVSCSQTHAHIAKNTRWRVLKRIMSNRVGFCRAHYQACAQTAYCTRLNATYGDLVCMVNAAASSSFADLLRTLQRLNTIQIAQLTSSKDLS
jgi:hypothetical protein